MDDLAEARLSHIDDHIVELEAERDRFREALEAIGRNCTAFTGNTNCVNSGRTRGAPYTADAWCDQCIAREALNGGGLPLTNTTVKAELVDLFGHGEALNGGAEDKWDDVIPVNARPIDED